MGADLLEAKCCHNPLIGSEGNFLVIQIGCGVTSCSDSTFLSSSLVSYVIGGR